MFRNKRSVVKSLQETPSSGCLVNYPPFWPRFASFLAPFCPLFTPRHFLSFTRLTVLSSPVRQTTFSVVRLMSTFCFWLFQLRLGKHPSAVICLNDKSINEQVHNNCQDRTWGSAPGGRGWAAHADHIFKCWVQLTRWRSESANLPKYSHARIIIGSHFTDMFSHYANWHKYMFNELQPKIRNSALIIFSIKCFHKLTHNKNPQCRLLQ